ncbi:MAG: hypothetical protein M1831_002722 [Alyxoria varia]|nr:MAG: hypothetical protein M1831_002722 [Alyxoria varia]
MGEIANEIDDSTQSHSSIFISPPAPNPPSARQRLPARRVIHGSSDDESTMADERANASKSPGLPSGPTLARKQSVSTSTFKNHPFMSGGPNKVKTKSKEESKSNTESKTTGVQKPHKPAPDRQTDFSFTNAKSDDKAPSPKRNSNEQFTDHGLSISPSKKQTAKSEVQRGEIEKANATLLSTDEIEQAIESKVEDFASSHSVLTKQMLNRAANRSELGLLEPDFGENLKGIRNGPTPMTERRVVQEKSPFAGLKPLNKKGNAISVSKASSGGGSVVLSSETSKKGSKKKTIHRSKIQPTEYKADAIDLPLYYHHTALPRSVLAPNNRVLTSWPPAVEDKAAKDSTWDPVVEELQELFPDERQNARPEILQQREKAKQLWLFVEKAFQQLGIKQSHILSFFQEGLERSTIEANNLKSKDVQSHRRWFEKNTMYKDLIEWVRRRIESDQSSTSEMQRLNAFMACTALWNTVNLPMHRFERARALGAECPPPKTMTSSEFYSSKSCSVCQLIECPYHGEYLEDYEDLDPNGAQIGEEDGTKTVSEVQADLVNHRLRMNASANRTVQPQVKLAYTDALSFDEQLGLEADGEARGKWNGSHEHDKDAGYKDDELCSEKCFWKKSNRKVTSTEKWSEEDLKYLEHILPGFSESKRGPCFLAMGLEKPCVEVSGFGLFMGEPAKRGEFIGEYKGHLMSAPETHRRGSVYQYGELTYLFRLTSAADPKTEMERGHEIDGMLASSKTRFINNSRLNKNINVVVKLLLANQVVRLAMFAGRDIEPGEELFFDYQLPEDHHSKLWEMGEKSNDITAARRQLIWGQSATAIGGPLPSGAAGLTNDATSSKKKKPRGLGLKQSARRKAGESDTAPKDGGEKSKKGKGKKPASHGEEDPNHALDASDYDDFQSFFEDPALLQQVSDSNDEDYREEGENSAVEYTPRKQERTRRLRARKNVGAAQNDGADDGTPRASRTSRSFANTGKRKRAPELDGTELDGTLDENEVDDAEGPEEDISSSYTKKGPPASKKAKVATNRLATTSASKLPPARTGKAIKSTSDIESESSASDADGNTSDDPETSKQPRKEAAKGEQEAGRGMARKQARPWPSQTPFSGTARKAPPVSEAPTIVIDSSDSEINRPSAEPKTTTEPSKKRKEIVMKEGADEENGSQKPNKKPRTSLHGDSKQTNSRAAMAPRQARSLISEKKSKSRSKPISSRLRAAGFTESDVPLSSSDSENSASPLQHQPSGSDYSQPAPARTERGRFSTIQTPARKISLAANTNSSSANSNEHSSQLYSTGDSGRSGNYRRIVIEDTGSEPSNQGASDHEGVEDQGIVEDQSSPCKGRKRKRPADEGLLYPPNGHQNGTEDADKNETTHTDKNRHTNNDDKDTNSRVSRGVRSNSAKEANGNNNSNETKDDEGESPKVNKKSLKGPPAKKTKVDEGNANATAKRGGRKAPVRRRVK